MSDFFNSLDVAGIPDDPFAAPEGTHIGVVSSITNIKLKDGQVKTVFTYEIDDEDSDYYGTQAQEWLTNHPDVDNDTLKLLKGKERFTIVSDLARIRKRLAYLGVDETDMASVSFSDLEGTPIKFTVVKSESVDDHGNKKVYTNVRYVSKI